MVKERFTRVDDPAEITALLSRRMELDTPDVWETEDGVYVPSEQLRAWRAARTTHQSEAKP